MELRHLRYFAAVAEELHFTRAAAKLGIAQPPLTQQIKALERELGVDLFVRAGRGVSLTSAGTAFLADAKIILAHVAAASLRARDASRGRVGRLGVGFTESASFHPLVTEAFRGFRAAYPDVQLDLSEGHSPTLIAALEDGSLDLAFVRPPFTPSRRIAYEVLAEEAMAAALPIDHRLAGRQSLRLQELAEERFVLYPRTVRPGLADEVVNACRRAGFEPAVGQETPQLSSTINLVAAGLGVSIVPEGMRQVRPQAVRYLPIEDLDLCAYLAVARRVADPSALSGNFVALLRR